MKGSADPPCRCGRPLPFARCCGRYPQDFEQKPAPDAEALMRSHERSRFVREGGRWYCLDGEMR